MAGMPTPQSPLAAALERVGDRWSLLLIEALLDGPRRFGELGEAVGGIAPNILTDRLRRLEAERIFHDQWFCVDRDAWFAPMEDPSLDIRRFLERHLGALAP